jgi:hypothetical protein
VTDQDAPVAGPDDAGDTQGPHLLLYRVVRSSPPTEWDMTSHEGRGIPLRFRTARALRRWSGLSVFSTPWAAIALARENPRLGGWLAELRVPLDGSIRMELDNGAHGHCTIWGDPKLILSFVVSVRRAEGVH